jgi:hypothetical protein
MRKIGVLTLSLLFTAGSLLAQQGGEAKKPLSPPARTAAKIGGVDVSVDYSAPSKRGRAIMGGLVPYGKVWRTGANAATSLKVGGDLMIGDLHVPGSGKTGTLSMTWENVRASVPLTAH